MDKLLPYYNELLDIKSKLGLDLDLPLPTMIAVGEQSAGKSSVLESVIGKPILPRGTGMVTRCPIVIQLNHLTTGSTYHDASSDSEGEEQKAPPSLKMGTNGPEEWCTVGGGETPDKMFKNFEDAKAEIQRRFNEMAGANLGIVTEQIVLKVHSPKVLNLTLVDLPGLVKVAVGAQAVDIEDQVSCLVRSYMEDDNAIILCICDATKDIATSEALKMAQQVDPHGNRTMVVLTRVDRIEEGIDGAKILSGEGFTGKMGTIGVINRSQVDIDANRSIEDSIRSEEIYLRRKYPSIAGDHGTAFLRLKLQQVLMEKIQACLPQIEPGITDLINSTRAELDSYGRPIEGSKRSILLSSIRIVCDEFRAAILGKPRNIEDKFLTGGAAISDIFKVKLPNEVQQIDPLSTLKDDEILVTILNTNGLEPTYVSVEKASLDIARKQILRLEGPALKCATLVNQQLHKIEQLCLKDPQVDRFPKLAAAIGKAIAQVRTQFHEDVRQNLMDYVAAQAAYAFTLNADYHKKLADGMKAGVSSEAELRGQQPQQVTGTDPAAASNALETMRNGTYDIVKNLVTTYYNITKEAFQDYVPKVIAFKVIYKMEKKLHDILLEKLDTTDNQEELVQESSFILERKRAAEKRLQDYEQAADTIARSRDTFI